MNEIILSIVIPIYKVEKYIDQCLGSIFNQKNDLTKFEVIIVNDGTPDNSMKVVLCYEKKYNNIKIINQNNSGLSVARNVGMKSAVGKYIWFVDSDDKLLNFSISNLLNLFDKTADVQVYATILSIKDEKTNRNRIEYYPDTGYLSGKEYLKKGYRQGATQRFIISREFLNDIQLNFYPHIYHEDDLFGYQLLYLTSKLYIIETPLYEYLERECGSIMKSITTKNAEDLIFIHKQLISFLEDKVETTDKKWYRDIIFSVIRRAFYFCRGIINSNDYKSFFNKNRIYIYNESISLIKDGKYLKGIDTIMFLRIRLVIKYYLRLLWK